MGAGKLERVGKGIKDAVVCGFAFATVTLGAVILLGRPMTMLFLDEPNPQVIEYAYQYLFITTAGYSLLGIVNIVRFAIQGMGYSVFAVTAGVMETTSRLLAGVVLVKFMGFTAICMAHVLAWIFADLFLIPAFFHCKRKAEKMHGMDKKEKQQSWNGKLQIS